MGCYDVIGLSEEIYHFHVKDSLWGAGVGVGGVAVCGTGPVYSQLYL